MNNITNFDDYVEANQFLSEDNYQEPHVSLIKDPYKIEYNPRTDYKKQYFTIEALSDGSISFLNTIQSANETIHYSKNNGKWTELTSSYPNGTALYFHTGDIVRFKGDNSSYGISTDTPSKNCCFAYDGGFTYNVYGNIMSLINSTDFENLTYLSSKGCFYGFFENCSGLINANNLILPATTLTQYCYKNMFNNCTHLISAPQLPAINLQIGCYSWMFNNCCLLEYAPLLPAFNTNSTDIYNQMFDGCSKLKYIKYMSLNLPSTTGCYSWISGIASTGTFVKNALATYSHTYGASALPRGWTFKKEYPKHCKLTATTSADDRNRQLYDWFLYAYENGTIKYNDKDVIVYLEEYDNASEITCRTIEYINGVPNYVPICVITRQGSSYTCNTNKTLDLYLT